MLRRMSLIVLSFLLSATTPIHGKESAQPNVKLYEDMLKKDPKNVEALLALGLAYASKGEYRKAVDYTEKAVDIDPSYVAHYQLGVIHAANDEPKKALKSFDRALKKNPKSHMAEFQKGLVYADQKKFDDAIRVYQHAIQLHPHFYDAYVGLGGVYFKKGDQASALLQAQKLEELGQAQLAKELRRWIQEKQIPRPT